MRARNEGYIYIYIKCFLIEFKNMIKVYTCMNMLTIYF